MRCQTRSPIQSQQCCLNGLASDGLIAAHAPVCFDSRRSLVRFLSLSLPLGALCKTAAGVCAPCEFARFAGDSRARAQHTCLGESSSRPKNLQLLTGAHTLLVRAAMTLIAFLDKNERAHIINRAKGPAWGFYVRKKMFFWLFHDEFLNWSNTEIARINYAEDDIGSKGNKSMSLRRKECAFVRCARPERTARLFLYLNFNKTRFVFNIVDLNAYSFQIKPD
jgi:hypothetical protein